MLTLCGFAASNYYNKVKFALLEKGVPFEEELAWVGKTDPAASPIGKVPYIKTPQGPVCESAVIMEYIEQQYPQTPLLPSDPFAAAKVRELVTFLELHLELVARNLYPEAFFGGKVSDSAKEKTGAQLEKNIAAFKQLARFAPFVAGDQFTVADCAALWAALIPRAPQAAPSFTLLPCKQSPVLSRSCHLATPNPVGSSKTLNRSGSRCTTA
mgnify:CR=1 FL=1